MEVARHWCFTAWCEKTTEGLLLNPKDIIDAKIRYVVWQKEECPDTRKPHFQGYIEFKSPQRRAAVKRCISSRSAHCNPRHKTREQARAYCRKDETRLDGPWELGTWTGGQGSRSDLIAVHDAIKSGKADVEISDEFFPQYVKYYRGITQYRLLHETPRKHKMEIVVYYGPSGTGKSKSAWAQAPDAHAMQPDSASTGVGWWDGYCRHTDVIIDDYYGQFKYSFMLQLLDRYPLRVNTKGGTVNFVAKRIFITSNKHPSEWYNYDKFNQHAWTAFERRLTRIVECNHNMWWIKK